MAINFPASPADGDVYLGYYWDDAKGAWRSQQINSSAVITSPTAPSGATSGDFWFNSSDGTLYLYFDNGITTQWVEVRSQYATSQVGLVPIVPTSVTLGSGTASVSTNGLVTFTSASSVSLNGVFSSTYRNYKIIASETGTTSANFYFRLRQNSSDDSTNNYSFGCYEVPRSGSNITYQGFDQNFAYISSTSSSQYRGGRTIELQNPYDSNAWTNYESFSSDAYYLGLVITGGMYTVGKMFNGISFITNGAITGTVQIYGYN